MSNIILSLSWGFLGVVILLKESGNKYQFIGWIWIGVFTLITLCIVLRKVILNNTLKKKDAVS